MNEEYIEGYWNNNTLKGIKLPYPIETNEEVPKNFLKKLEKLEDVIMDNNDNNILKEYRKIEFLQTKGYSRCRICNERNGSCEYVFTYRNKKYRFPEGLRHYYENHNVQPTNEFYNTVMNYNI
jgi:hypothetical protein